MSLIKKLFWPKKDYVKIFERFDDENSLNEFFHEVNKKGGKIISVENVGYSELFSNYAEVGGFSGEFGNLISSKVNKKTIVHYRSPNKIEYTLKDEKEFQELEEKTKRRLESHYSLKSLKKMIKKYKMEKEKPVKEEIIEKKSEEDDYNPFGDDLPF